MTNCLSIALILIGLTCAPAAAQNDVQPRAARTAAEANKNIQVLKTLAADELFPAMQFMAASLGVGCDYCHVSDNSGRWPMEKDDKPQKLAARRMLTMVQQINQTHFDGQNRITCASCHHGANRPSPFPPVLDAEHVDRFTAAAALDAKQPAPTARAVLVAFVAAIGGAEANAKITSRRWKGTVTSNGGRPLGFEVVEAAPDKLHVDIIGEQGTTVQGVDGETVWTRDPQFGIRRETGFEALRMRRLADFHRNEKLDTLDPSLALIGVQTIDRRRAYVLQGALASTQIERLYFDTTSGLLVRRLTLTQTALGLLPEQTDYDDYRSVGAVKLPFVIRRSGASFSNVQKYDTIGLNAAVEPGLFAKPDVK